VNKQWVNSGTRASSSFENGGRTTCQPCGLVRLIGDWPTLLWPYLRISNVQNLWEAILKYIPLLLKCRRKVLGLLIYWASRQVGETVTKCLVGLPNRDKPPPSLFSPPPHICQRAAQYHPCYPILPSLHFSLSPCSPTDFSWALHSSPMRSHPPPQGGHVTVLTCNRNYTHQHQGPRVEPRWGQWCMLRRCSHTLPSDDSF
jgi:hypothetical protein